MSYDLAVLAMGPAADVAEVRAMFDRCTSGPHDEGDLDERIVGFYERLVAEFPDSSTHTQDTPWMSTLLSTGIDHVMMHLSFSSRSDRVLVWIHELAAELGLAIWDPQFNDVVPADGADASSG